MNFDNPAWRATPFRTGLRVFKSLLRRRIPLLSRVVVPYDGARSLIYADLMHAARASTCTATAITIRTST